LATRGGHYLGTPYDTQTPYIQQFLAFIGLHDVHFTYAEGLNLGRDSKLNALTQANKAIHALIA
jgi:FMN-dependent NADH-azoreductase